MSCKPKCDCNSCRVKNHAFNRGFDEALTQIADTISAREWPWSLNSLDSRYDSGAQDAQLLIVEFIRRRGRPRTEEPRKPAPKCGRKYIRGHMEKLDGDKYFCGLDEEHEGHCRCDKDGRVYVWEKKEGEKK